MMNYPDANMQGMPPNQYNPMQQQFYGQPQKQYDAMPQTYVYPQMQQQVMPGQPQIPVNPHMSTMQVRVDSQPVYQQ